MSADSIAGYGVRNVTLGASQVCCSDQPCENFEGGCAPLDQCFDE